MIDNQLLIELYKLNDLTRYNTRPRIKDESVAVHSYYVVLLTMMLCDKLYVSKSVKMLAVKKAALHDLPEIKLSDVPYSVKQDIPELKEILDNNEDRVLAEIIDSPKNFFTLDDYSIEVKSSLIVKIADKLSVVQYCLSEAQLGNTSFVKIKEDTIKQIDKLIEDFIAMNFNDNCSLIKEVRKSIKLK